jgi:hypothetical protein
MRTLARYLLIVEVAVCYGPGFLMLAVGVLMTPLWVAMLVAVAFDAKFRHATSLLEVGLILQGPLSVVGGVLGFTGLSRVLDRLLSTTEELPYTGRTRAFVLIGAGTVIYWVLLLVAVYIVGSFGPSWNRVHVWPDLWPLPVVFVPALIASGHIVYLARRGLFAHGPPHTSP